MCCGGQSGITVFCLICSFAIAPAFVCEYFVQMNELACWLIFFVGKFFVGTFLTSFVALS